MKLKISHSRKNENFTKCMQIKQHTTEPPLDQRRDQKGNQKLF